MLWSRRSFFTLTGLGFLGVVACQRPPSEPPAAVPLKVGLLVPLTGAAATTDGEPTVQAAQLAIQEINAQGGISLAEQSRPLEAVAVDTTDSPDQAVAATRQLLLEQDVVAIVGLPMSHTAIPIAQFLETVPLPALSTTSTNPETTANKPHIFRVGFVDDVQGFVLAQFAQEQLQAQTAAMLYDISAVYNRDLADRFQSAFTALGGTVVATEMYTSDRATDFRPQLERIQAQAPEILLLPNYITDLARQTQQAREVGITATFLGADAWDDFRLDPQWAIESDVEGAYYTTMWYPDRDREAVTTFLAAYEAAYGDTPNVNAVLAYDAIHLLAEAIAGQADASPPSIQQGLANLQGFEGVSGTISYEGTGDPKRTVFVVQIQEGQAELAQQIVPG